MTSETAHATRRWRGLERWFLAGLLACVALGFGIRWTNIAVVRPVCQPPGLDADSDCYELYLGPSDPLYGHLQGRLIADGHWFVNPYVALFDPDRDPGEPIRLTEVEVRGELVPSVGDPPLYQLFLGGLSALGIESGQGHRHASAIVGLATIPLVGLLTRRLAGPAAGLFAGFVAAVHPLLWITDGMLLSEAIYAPLVAGVLAVAVRFRDRPGVGGAAALGLLVTLAAFARGEAILLLGLLVPPVVLGARSVELRRRIGFLAVAAAVAGSLLLPWNLWLNSRFDERVMMTAASGSVLSASSCDEHFYGDDLALHIYCAVDVDIPPGVDESRRDALVRDASAEYLRANLDRLPVVVAARVGRMWDLYGPAENLSMNIAVEDRGDLPSRAGLAVYWSLLPFAVVGAISLHRRREIVWPYVAVAVMVSATAAMTFGLTRYRVPADVVVIVLGAVGVDAVVRAVIRRRSTGPAGTPT